MKKIICLVLACIMCFASGCSLLPSPRENQGNNSPFGNNSELIKIPDLSNVDEASAKSSLTAKGLLPVVEYEYSDKIAKGNVIRTTPYAGTSVKEDTKVTLFVSLGPRSISASDSTIEWYHINSSKPDVWDFYAPEIIEGYLYIACETTFGTSFTFQSNGFGNASLSDSFTKTVPITILDEKGSPLPYEQKVSAGKLFCFIIRIPIKELEAERPTHIACEIAIMLGTQHHALDISFNMTW